MAAGALKAAVVEGEGAGRHDGHVAELTEAALHPAREVAVDVLDGSGAGCVWVHERLLKHKNPNPAHGAHTNWGHEGTREIGYYATTNALLLVTGETGIR